MHTLALGSSSGIQFLELENLHKDSGTWRQVPPYAESDGRTMITSHGTWKWEQVVRSWVSGRSRITVTVYEFLIQEAGNTVSLGYYENKSLPTGSAWGRAYRGRLDKNIIRPGTITLPPASYFWKLTYQATVHPAWFGVFLKVGGHLAAGGQESATGVIASVADFSGVYGIAIETARVGPGLGGSFGVAIGIFTGFPSPQAMVGFRDDSWDFALSIAEKWSSYVNLFSDGGKYARLGGQLRSLQSVAKTANPTKELADRLQQLGGLGDIYKVFQSGNSAAEGASETARQSAARSINLFDIPASGKGLEIGVYKAWSEVTAVTHV